MCCTRDAKCGSWCHGDSDSVTCWFKCYPDISLMDNWPYIGVNHTFTRIKFAGINSFRSVLKFDIMNGCILQVRNWMWIKKYWTSGIYHICTFAIQGRSEFFKDVEAGIAGKVVRSCSTVELAITHEPDSKLRFQAKIWIAWAMRTTTLRVPLICASWIAGCASFSITRWRDEEIFALICENTYLQQ